MNVKRHLHTAIAKVEKMFGAVLLAGARQVGKTTLLRTVKSELPYITLDDPVILDSANAEPGAFFKAVPPPVVVDEIQYAPQLFPRIKMLLDATGKKGQFFLSGSQQFHMMKNVGESLAGRIGILNLFGLSLREIQGIDFEVPFLPDDEYLAKRKKYAEPLEYNAVWEIIHRGSMPAMSAGEDMDWQLFYAAYTRTYLERDVRDLAQMGDGVKFLRLRKSSRATRTRAFWSRPSSSTATRRKTKSTSWCKGAKRSTPSK